MNKSFDEKIRLLNSSGRSKLLNYVINALFKDYLDDNEFDNALKLFNHLLNEMGYDSLQYRDDINQCKLIVADVRNLNSLRFIEKYVNLFFEVGINVDEVFDMKLAKTRKLYGAVILDAVANKLGYSLQGYYTKELINDKIKNLRKYRFIKNN